jgi:NTE family protein
LAILGLSQGGAVALGLLALCACDHFAHVTNEGLCGDGAVCRYDPDFGYRFAPRKSARDTFIVVTFSGGGVRAAALAYGTLQALKQLPATAGEGTLLDEVDVISSVSGGSVTAAWYALKGQGGLQPVGREDALVKFLRNDDAMGSLFWRGLNPLALTRYAFTTYQRSDVLAQFFSDRLFGDATYAAVKGRYETEHDQPFVILNATDLGHETGFPFTQNRFDLICSDLDRYKLAYAVAASANFPMVFSPIGINNYSGDCAAQRDPAWLDRGPPRWIASYAPYDASDQAGAKAPSPRSDGLAALRGARQAREYLDLGLTADDKVLHLIDGGLVDNLGVQSTLALEDEAECAPGVFQRLRKPRPPAYERIREVVFIVVNARTRSPAGIDASIYPPNVVSSLFRVIDTPLDNTILDTQNYLSAELQAIAAPSSTYRPPGISLARTCWSNRPETRNAVPTNLDDTQKAVRTRIVTIDFEMIPTRPCRNKFWDFGTTWTLPTAMIDDLIELPKPLLRRSPELTELYHDMKRPPPDFDRLGFSADFSGVCAPLGQP